MKTIGLDELLALHRRIIASSGGSDGIRGLNAVKSALAQPEMTFGGEELYPSLADKAAALGYSLVMNHPFVDGNKRIGHAAMEFFLLRNGFEINSSTDEQEKVVLGLAAGEMEREDFVGWLKAHLTPFHLA